MPSKAENCHLRLVKLTLFYSKTLVKASYPSASDDLIEPNGPSKSNRKVKDLVGVSSGKKPTETESPSKINLIKSLTEEPPLSPQINDNWDYNKNNK